MIKTPQKKQFSTNKTKEIKHCRADKETVVFSYSHVCKDDSHNFNCFKSKKAKTDMAESFSALNNKLAVISKITWEQFYSQQRQAGMEYIPVSEFDRTFINSLDYELTDDDKLISVRFDAQGCRLILKRGSKCGRVAQILGIDLRLDLYKH